LDAIDVASAVITAALLAEISTSPSAESTMTDANCGLTLPAKKASATILVAARTPLPLDDGLNVSVNQVLINGYKTFLVSTILSERPAAC
jgi:hypothetical protein